MPATFFENFGFFLLLGGLALAAGIGTGLYGQAKGLPFSSCFLLGMFTPPPVGFIIVSLLPDRPSRRDRSLDVIIAIEQAKMEADARKRGPAGI